MIRYLLVSFFAILMFVPTVQAADDAKHRELLSKHYRLEKPDGEGPFPTVMMVPGCSGFHADFATKQYNAVQLRLVELGFVTLRVDYLAARNAASCQQGASPEQKGVSTEEVAGDLSIAFEYLQQQPFVKNGAINVIGWSYGASGALVALGRTWNRDPIQVDAVVAYYPHCGLVTQKWKSNVPILILVGAIDNITPLRFCRGLFGGLPVTVHEYENAHHSFDMSELPAEMQYQFGTIGYNEAAAKSAWKEVTNFLRK